MFKDTINLRFQAGRGGDGGVSIGKSRKPDGGIGGDGGSIYLEGTTNLFDYRNFTENKIFKAEDGERGGRGNQYGKYGEDLIIKVPLATNIYDEKNRLFFCIEKDDERKMLAKGGRGGAGNYHFRRGGAATIDKYKEGKPGETLAGHWELELISDVIFIGLPNAGKSSILDELSEAKPKIADYKFTTLTPYLGMADGITMMDLPGLIEGTFEGKGLGTSFEKHTRRTKLIAHFVSLEFDDPIEDYKVIRKELKNIDEILFNKPEILILSKSDEKNKKEIVEIEKKFKDYFKKKGKTPIKTLHVSILEPKESGNLLNIFRDILV